MEAAAVEVHSLEASVSLAELRALFRQVAPVLQAIGALDTDSPHGVALLIFSSGDAAAAAVELFDGYPLHGSVLRVRPAESLPLALVNLLYSLAAATPAAAQGGQLPQLQLEALVQAAAGHRAQLPFLQPGAAAAAAAADAEGAARESAPWQPQQQQVVEEAGMGADAVTSAPPRSNGTEARKFSSNRLTQLDAEMRHLQVHQQEDSAADSDDAAGSMAALSRPQIGTWASAAAAAPPMAADAADAKDGWEQAMGSSSKARAGKKLQAPKVAVLPPSAMGRQAPSPTTAGSSNRSRQASAGRDSKAPRPGGQDSASIDPTTKLWMGGIDGAASAETVKRLFGRYGAIFDYELQPATHEKGRTDQWGFVNFRRVEDAQRAYEALMGEVVPELTGSRKLKLQFRPVDSARRGRR